MFYSYHENVLSDILCEQVMIQARALGFEKAKVNVYGQQQDLTMIRNNSRLEWDNAPLAKEINSLLTSLPDFPFIYKNLVYQYLSSHFRVYHYVSGQYFKPHRDGHLVLDGKTSQITVLCYLNDTQGGQTILMPQGVREKDLWINIQPKKGSVLMFDHDFWHQALPVQGGEKLVLRTELFYPTSL